ncbi:grasp-with-spasm system ATP-grasp peptide maturase [Chitinophaga polysaccharea]|uniref:grasp-with-spasm system ATP-grasp peptide maturase n=1 Tax=Chitinophaga polysaccharea TaxID=1293035 RepID=UPI00115772FE|nr:grasp-with-spasm system ATP-grasp peptide maturase [Chitinophaga polysaccharea]
MILILSRGKSETTTEIVIDWIMRLGGNYIRVNGDDISEKDNPYGINISNEFSKFNISGEGIDYDSLTSDNKINVVWYRKWIIPYGAEYLKLIGDGDLAAKVQFHLSGEANGASYGLYSQFLNAKWLDNPLIIRSLQKPIILKIANELGLNVPATLITNNIKELKGFLKLHSRIVTKCITDGIFLTVNGIDYGMYTKEITWLEIGELKTEYFYPSLFQELLDKMYELRIFYLNGKVYSMAIFSQNDPQTAIDFRKYNLRNPNRYVPYKLPEEIEQKLRLLMKKLDLKCGSIDIVRKKDGAYYFLEVNPLGQFGMVSGPCNYYLEKEVAKYLIKNDK